MMGKKNGFGIERCRFQWDLADNNQAVREIWVDSSATSVAQDDRWFILRHRSAENMTVELPENSLHLAGYTKGPNHQLYRPRLASVDIAISILWLRATALEQGEGRSRQH
jgi:hypothetical protein